MSFRMFNFSGGLDVPLSTVRCTRMVILDLFQFRREPIKAFSDLDRRRSKCETMAAMNQSGGFRLPLRLDFYFTCSFILVRNLE